MRKPHYITKKQAKLHHEAAKFQKRAIVLWLVDVTAKQKTNLIWQKKFRKKTKKNNLRLHRTLA